MKRVKNRMLIFTLLLMALPSVAQDWTKVQGLPDTQFTALEVIDGIILTTSGNKLFYSNDGGENWEETSIGQASLVPSYLKKFENTLYVGMQGQDGIYSVPFDNLSGSWTSNTAVWEVSSFAEYNGSLYASTMGFGIYKLGAGNSWTHFMNGLPNYSYNVSKVLATPQTLIATAGGNGTFYRYNFITGLWEEDLYSTSFLPGLMIDDALLVNDKWYVSAGRRLLRSNNNGDTWIPDQSGLLYGLGRFLYKGKKSLYTLTTNFNPSNNDNFTYLRKRSLNALDGSSWAEGSEFLPFYAYAMAESGNKIYIASNDGLYFKTDLSLSTELPVDQKPSIVIAQNPLKNSAFILESSIPVDEILIYNMAGQLLSTQKHSAYQYNFELPCSGIYVIKAMIGNAVQNFKVVAGS